MAQLDHIPRGIHSARARLPLKHGREAAPDIGGLIVDEDAVSTPQGQAPPPGVPSGPPPGWYPDPQGQPVMRWWSGMGWTPHTQPQQGQLSGSPLPGQQSAAGPQPGAGQRSSQRGGSHWVRNVLSVIGALVVAGFIIGHISESSSPAATQAASSAGTGNPRAGSTGTIGSSFTVQDASGNTYSVTLDKIIDPVTSSDSFNTPDGGTRFMAAVFTIKATGGSPQNEDANNSASVTGNNSQSYSPQFADIAGYTNFDDGTIHVTQGQQVTGEVTFQLPDGVKAAKVQWTPQDGFGSPVQWAAGAPAGTAAAAHSGGTCSAQLASWRSNGGSAQFAAVWSDLENLYHASESLQKTNDSDLAASMTKFGSAGAALQRGAWSAQSDLPPTCTADARQKVKTGLGLAVKAGVECQEVVSDLDSGATSAASSDAAVAAKELGAGIADIKTAGTSTGVFRNGSPVS